MGNAAPVIRPAGLGSALDSPLDIAVHLQSGCRYGAPDFRFSPCPVSPQGFGNFLRPGDFNPSH
jgi:hypothetical protein